MAENGNGNGNGSLRGWLPVMLFLAAQTIAGIWWAATVSSNVQSLVREQDRQETKQEVFDLKLQVIDREFAVFKATGGVIVVEPQKGGRITSARP